MRAQTHKHVGGLVAIHVTRGGRPGLLAAAVELPAGRPSAAPGRQRVCAPLPCPGGAEGLGADFSYWCLFLLYACFFVVFARGPEVGEGVQMFGVGSVQWSGG